MAMLVGKTGWFRRCACRLCSGGRAGVAVAKRSAKRREKRQWQADLPTP